MILIAFLRGINVGGHHIVSMAELKKLFIRSGFKDVSTFINSGNVIFRTDDKNINGITTDIESALKKKFGFDIAVMIKTQDELKSIIRKEPFKNIDTDDKNYTKYITFLKNEPGNKAKKEFESLFNEKETIRIKGNVLYALISKRDNPKQLFTNMLIEKKLNTPATTRNINTIIKIIALAEKQSKAYENKKLQKI